MLILNLPNLSPVHSLLILSLSCDPIPLLPYVLFVLRMAIWNTTYVTTHPTFGTIRSTVAYVSLSSAQVRQPNYPINSLTFPLDLLVGQVNVCNPSLPHE